MVTDDQFDLDSLFGDDVITPVNKPDDSKSTESVQKNVDSEKHAKEVEEALTKELLTFDDDTDKGKKSVESTEHPWIKFSDEFESLDENKTLPDLNDADKLFDFIKNEREVYFENGLNALKDQIGEVGIKFLQYVKDGGDKMQFINNTLNSTEITKMPFSTQDDKIEFLKAVYKQEGKPEDEIEGLLNHYKTNSKVDDVAKTKRDAVIAKEASEAAELANKQKQAKLNLLKERDSYKTVIKTKLQDAKDLFEIPLPKDRNKLINFVSDYQFVDNKGKEFTKFDVELQKALQNQDQKLFLAYILMENFDLSFIKSAANTKFVSDKLEPKDTTVKLNTANARKSGTMGLREFADLI